MQKIVWIFKTFSTFPRSKWYSFCWKKKRQLPVSDQQKKKKKKNCSTLKIVQAPPGSVWTLAMIMQPWCLWAHVMSLTIIVVLVAALLDLCGAGRIKTLIYVGAERSQRQPFKPGQRHLSHSHYSDLQHGTRTIFVSGGVTRSVGKHSLYICYDIMSFILLHTRTNIWSPVFDRWAGTPTGDLPAVRQRHQPLQHCVAFSWIFKRRHSSDPYLIICCCCSGSPVGLRSGRGYTLDN